MVVPDSRCESRTLSGIDFKRAHPFRDDYLFYRFAKDEEHGQVATRSDGRKVSWADFLGPTGPTADSLQPRLPERDDRLGEFPAEDTTVTAWQGRA